MVSSLGYFTLTFRFHRGIKKNKKVHTRKFQGSMCEMGFNQKSFTKKLRHLLNSFLNCIRVFRFIISWIITGTAFFCWF